MRQHIRRTIKTLRELAEKCQLRATGAVLVTDGDVAFINSLAVNAETVSLLRSMLLFVRNLGTVIEAGADQYMRHGAVSNHGQQFRKKCWAAAADMVEAKAGVPAMAVAVCIAYEVRRCNRPLPWSRY